jgi:hypothetical protein
MSIQDSADYTFEHEVISCDFKWETGFQCQHPHFLVTGYTIEGQVLSYNEAMPNVKVYLHPGKTAIADKSKNFLKQAESDPQGAYRFQNIPSGTYQVVSTYAENQSKFSIKPDVIEVTVNGSPVKNEAFSVIGLSIFGKVVNNKEEGIGGVKIVIDGQQKAITNNQGVYKLDEITPGVYTLEGISNYYMFDSIKIEISPSSRQIQSLVATDYNICGKVQIDKVDAKSFSIEKRTVVLTDKSKGERRSQTDENGEFCFEVKPGQYTITPVVSADEKERGLKLLPVEKTVIVNGHPILDVNFN